MTTCCKVEKLKITTWNVRGLTESKHNPEPKTYNIIRILSRNGIDIAVLTETKACGASREEEYDLDGTRYNVHFSGVHERERNHHGMVLVVKAELWNAFSDQWEPIYKQLISAKLSNGNEERWIIGAYPQTNVSVVEVNNEFCYQLRHTLRQVPSNGMLILLGDFNANINPREDGCDRQVVGLYGCSRRPTSDNSLRLLDLCSCFALVLTNTLHKSGLKTS